MKTTNAEPLAAILASAGWVCADCGHKYGTWRGPTMTTWHDGKCEVCGKKTGVVHVRNYNYLHKTPALAPLVEQHYTQAAVMKLTGSAKFAKRFCEGCFCIEASWTDERMIVYWVDHADYSQSAKYPISEWIGFMQRIYAKEVPNLAIDKPLLLED